MVDAGNKEVVLPDGRGGGGRGIDAMPDGVLEHILGFLPAEDAVRTSVLAPRWRHLWKSATGLRIGCRDDEPRPVKEYQEFVDRLLLLRQDTPLDTCEIRLGEIQADEAPRANFWVRHAIQCKARTLKVQISTDYSLRLDNLPLVSRHLTKLELHCVVLRNSSLDFTSCPALETLQLNGGGLWKAKKIVSDSLKHLEITWCCIDDLYPDHYRVHVCCPSLVSLHIDGVMDIAPMLGSMPSLVKAFIRLTDWCADVCAKLDDPDCTDCLCEVCDGPGNANRGGTSCVLLNGLSEAKSLALISTYPNLIIFKADLRWCPMFNNLKTLLLNDHWCAPNDFHALTCILEHSPVLKKLTLQLFSEGPNHNVELVGGFSVMGPPAATISEHLDTVEIKCEVVDEKVLKVLEFLSSTFNICFSFC